MSTITSVLVNGYKGGKRCVTLAPLTMIVGPNGAGKSTVVEAIDFAMGRPVAGAAVDGAGIRDALDGRTMEVVLSVDGSNTVTRRRSLDNGGAFKRSDLTVNGDDEAAGAALAGLLGDMSPPRGQKWLTMSADLLSAELARLGATAEGVEKAESILRTGGKGETAEAAKVAETARIVSAGAIGGQSFADRLTACRDSAKRALNEATAKLRAIEGSTDRSREVQAADEAVTPDALAGLRTRHATAVADAEAAAKAFSASTEAGQSGHDAVNAWAATMAHMTRHAQDAADAVAAAARDLLEWPQVDSEAVARALAVGQDTAEELSVEREKALAAANAASDAAAAASAEAALAKRAVDAVATVSECPTCRQAIGPDVTASLRQALAAADARRTTAKTARESARAYLEDIDAELASVGLRDLQRAAERAATAEQARMRAEARLAAARTRSAAAAAALGDHKAAMPVKPDAAKPDGGVRGDLLEAANAAGAQRDKLHTELLAATAGAERYSRWRDDLRARKAAEDRKAAAADVLEKIRDVEDGMVVAGAKMLTSAMADFIPVALGVPEIDGWIGLRRGGKFIYGAGLSTAQQVALGIALDRALDGITGRQFRLAVVEADALDATSLDHMMAAFESALFMGDLDQAIIVTCHPPGYIGEWARVYVGGSGPTDPPPTGTDDPPSPAALPQNAAGDNPHNVVVTAVGDTFQVSFDLPAPPAALVPIAAGDAIPPAGTADWLWRPGTAGAEKPQADEINEVANALSSEAAAAMHGWLAYANNPTEPSVLGVADPSPDVIAELTAANLLHAGTMTARGKAVWRHMRAIDPPAPAPAPAREDAPPPPGVGGTFEEVVAMIKPLNAEAIRWLGTTRASIGGTVRMTVPFWRKEIATKFLKNGYDRESIARWVADAAERFPKRPAPAVGPAAAELEASAGAEPEPEDSETA